MDTETAAPAAVLPRRSASVSVCVLALHGDSARVQLTCFEVSPCARLAACGRDDGVVLLARYSRSDVLASRFAAPERSRPPLRKSRLVALARERRRVGREVATENG